MVGISDKCMEMLCSSRISIFLLHSSNPSYSFPWQAVCWALMCGKRSNTKLTDKCTGSHQVIITHVSEVDPTGIEGLSNFSLVVDLVKRIKCWLGDLWFAECKLHEIKESGKVNCWNLKDKKLNDRNLKCKKCKLQNLKVQEM